MKVIRNEPIYKLDLEVNVKDGVSPKVESYYLSNLESVRIKLKELMAERLLLDYIPAELSNIEKVERLRAMATKESPIGKRYNKDLNTALGYMKKLDNISTAFVLYPSDFDEVVKVIEEMGKEKTLFPTSYFFLDIITVQSLLQE